MTQPHRILWFAFLAVALLLAKPAAAQKVYATDSGIQSPGFGIWVIDGSTNPPARTKIVPVSKSPGSIVVTPDGKTAYVANICDGNPGNAPGFVLVVDLVNQVELTPPIALTACPGPIVITPDGAQVYVGDYPDSVAVINTATGMVSTTIQNVNGVGSPATGNPFVRRMAISPDGKNLYVASPNQFPTAVISTVTNTVVAMIDGSIDSVDGNGNFWSASGGVYIGTSSTTSTTFPVGCDTYAIGFTPDGKKAYFADGEPECGNMIYEVNTAVWPPTLGPSFNFPCPGSTDPSCDLGPAGQFAFSSDSKTGYIALSISAGAGVVVFDTTTHGLLTMIQGFVNSGGQGVTHTGGIAAPLTSPPINTPLSSSPGSPVTVSLDNNAVTVTFQGGVTTPGTTTASILGTNCPAAAAGFQLGTPPVCYDISTNAQYTSPVTVCISDPSITANSQLVHYENGVPNPLATTYSPGPPPMLCGDTSSLSPFAIEEPTSSGETATSTTISLTPAATIPYGTAATALVTVSPTSGTVAGNVTVSVDGGAAITMALLGGSASLNLGVLGAGNHSLAANFAAQGSFLGSSASGTFTVARAPLTITANNRSKTYGQTVTFAGTEFNTSGLVNADNVASVALTSAGAAASASVAGSPYPITPSAAVGTRLGNYNITYVNGALTVSPALLTITAGNATKILDALNPSPLPWTPIGFVNGENASVLTANPTCSATATTTSPVGTYPITCSGAAAPNYTFTYVAGTLKILYATSIGHVIQPPINADGSSVYKQGRTVTAKFDVYDANGVAIGTPGVVSSFFLTSIVSGTTTTSVEDVVDTNNPDTAFRWDGQEWIFNITTGNLTTGSTYVYTIALNDGSTIVFQYGLR